MNRWLLTIAALAAAGSAIAASTSKPPARKAEGARKAVSVKTASALPRTTVAPKATQPVPTPTTEAGAPSASDPTLKEVTGAPTAPAAEPAPTVPAAAPAAADGVQPPVTTAPEPAAGAPAATPVIAEERDVVIRRNPNLAGGATDEVEIEVDGKTGELLSRRYLNSLNGFNAFGLTANPMPAMLNKQISLELNDATVREAVDAVVKKAGDGLTATYEKDVPTDARISVKVKQASAASLLNLITQNAGIGWAIMRSDVKKGVELRITRKPRSNAAALTLNDYSRSVPPGHQMLDLIVAPSIVSDYAGMRRTVLGEQRMTLECPHCKVKSTIIRQRHQPTCTKCSRTFQNDWQFCPADGTKRPADPNEWKFCPNCGKKVDVEKASVEGVPFLEDLPIVGDLFRKPTPGSNAPANPNGLKAVPAIPGLRPLAPVPAVPVKPGRTPIDPNANATPSPTPALPGKPLPTPPAPEVKPAPVPVEPPAPKPVPLPEQ